MKKAYFTVDDAPSDDMNSVVDILIDKNIPPIWYCRGEFIEKRLQILVDAIHKGCIIANHSYSHPYFSTIPLTECIEEITRTESLIDLAYAQAKKSSPL